MNNLSRWFALSGAGSCALLILLCCVIQERFLTGDSIKVSSLQIIDDKGQVRMRCGVNGESAGLWLYNERGELFASIEEQQETAQIALFHQNGQAAVQLISEDTLHHGDSQRLMLSAENGPTHVCLGNDPVGRGSVLEINGYSGGQAKLGFPSEGLSPMLIIHAPAAPVDFKGTITTQRLVNISGPEKSGVLLSLDDDGRASISSTGVDGKIEWRVP